MKKSTATKKAEPDDARIGQRLALLKRQQKALFARDKFMEFVKFTTPDPEDPNDVERSRYKDAKHHRAIAKVLEEVEKGSIQQLILTCPPRHGKSELTTRRFPAWYIGRNPRDNVVVATYNDTFAEDFGGEVRYIINSPQFKQTFPGVTLRRGSTAKDRLQVHEGGQLSFVGRGGSLTGRGAHCLVQGTTIHTSTGDKPIEAVAVGDKVLSYDVRSGSLVWKAVEAVARRPRARVFRITTASGRVVEATSDHRFYADEQWRDADQLTSGDRLVCVLRQDVHETGMRLAEASSAQAAGVLLLQRMLGARGERSEIRAQHVRTVQRAGAESGAVWKRLSLVLLQGLHGARTRGRIRAACARAHEALRALQRDVFAGQFNEPLLQPRLFFASACTAYGEGGQSPLEGWRLRESSEAARHAPLPRTSPLGFEEGRATLPDLRSDRTSGSASHRREPAEQPSVEPCDAMQSLPPPGSLFAGARDFVLSVEDTGRSAVVYDIQVEETECFFANGVLAHNCLIIDDLIKDDKEASSQAIRDQAWQWFTKVAMTRRMGKKLVIVIMTRWHSDDIVGRLTDPENPNYNAIESAKWKIINLPAIAEDDDPLGRKPGEALWPDGPDKFDLEFLSSQQRLDPMGFSALYQQRPSAVDGLLFRRESVRLYEPKDLPENLRIYAASDHAVSVAARRDYTCLLVVGVDRQSNIYLLDCWWKRALTDEVTEAMLEIGRLRKPLIWWAERGHISKSIGPFLRKRMMETNTFFAVNEVTPVGDKEQRAQSFAARMSMGYVWFPKNAPWVERAVNELLGFPNATHDDFVDTCSLIGLGLGAQVPASAPAKASGPPKYGTLAWARWSEEAQRQYELEQEAGGM